MDKLLMDINGITEEDTKPMPKRVAELQEQISSDISDIQDALIELAELIVEG